MRVVSAELEFVAATQRLVDVVLAGRVHLVAIAPSFGAGRGVARADVGRGIEQRLVAAVEIGREEDPVQPDARVDEEPLRDTEFHSTW